MVKQKIDMDTGWSAVGMAVWTTVILLLLNNYIGWLGKAVLILFVVLFLLGGLGGIRKQKRLFANIDNAYSKNTLRNAIILNISLIVGSVMIDWIFWAVLTGLFSFTPLNYLEVPSLPGWINGHCGPLHVYRTEAGRMGISPTVQTSYTYSTDGATLHVFDKEGCYPWAGGLLEHINYYTTLEYDSSPQTYFTHMAHVMDDECQVYSVPYGILVAHPKINKTFYHGLCTS